MPEISREAREAELRKMRKHTLEKVWRFPQSGEGWWLDPDGRSAEQLVTAILNREYGLLSTD